MFISLENFNSNIAHFLHEQLQYLLDLILNNLHINYKLLIHPDFSTLPIYRWHYGILYILANKQPNFELKIYDGEIDIFNIYPNNNKKIINIEHIKYLQKIVFEYYNIDYNVDLPEYKVLYTRTKDTNRRHLLNSECLKDNFDLIIDSLDISFEDHVRLFSKITHFVTIEGAHLTNIIFMQPFARIKNINTVYSTLEKHNSWQLFFGTYVLIKEFNIENKELTRISCSNGAACGSHDFNDHVLIDNKLKEEIIFWLNNKK